MRPRSACSRVRCWARFNRRSMGYCPASARWYCCATYRVGPRPRCVLALQVYESNQRVLLHRGRSRVRQALEEYLAQ